MECDDEDTLEAHTDNDISLTEATPVRWRGADEAQGKLCRALRRLRAEGPPRPRRAALAALAAGPSSGEAGGGLRLAQGLEAAVLRAPRLPSAADCSDATLELRRAIQDEAPCPYNVGRAPQNMRKEMTSRREAPVVAGGLLARVRLLRSWGPAP